MIQSKIKTDQVNCEGGGNIATDVEVAQMISGSFFLWNGNLEVTGNITALSSGSVLKSLRVQNNELVGDDLEVKGNVKVDGDLYINNDNTDVDAVLYFGKPTTGTEQIKWNKITGRFNTTNSLLVNGVLYANGNIYINFDYGNVDAILYFNKPTTGYETLSWDKTDNRFEFSDNLYIDGTIENTSSGSVLKSLRIQNNELIGGTLEVKSNETVDGYVQALTSGSVLKSLRIQNNLQVGGSLDVRSPQFSRRFLVFALDFLGTAATSEFLPFTATAIGSGTHVVQLGVAGHPGIVRVTSSTTANSGYRYQAGLNSSFLFGGGEVAEWIFRIPTAIQATGTIRFGYHDTTTVTDATDGAYIEILSNHFTGKTANNSTRSTTGTAYTLSADTWYRAKIVVNNDATRVDFYLYNGSGTQLWTDYLTNNIPTGAGREFGIGIVATNSNTSAVVLVDNDAIFFYSLRDAR